MQKQQQTKNGPLLFFTAPGIQPVFLCGRKRRHSLRAMPHHSKCRCSEQEVHAAKQKSQTILFLQHRLCLVRQVGIARCCLSSDPECSSYPAAFCGAAWYGRQNKWPAAPPLGCCSAATSAAPAAQSRLWGRLQGEHAHAKCDYKRKNDRGRFHCIMYLPLLFYIPQLKASRFQNPACR